MSETAHEGSYQGVNRCPFCARSLTEPGPRDRGMDDGEVIVCPGCHNVAIFEVTPAQFSFRRPTALERLFLASDAGAQRLAGALSALRATP